MLRSVAPSPIPAPLPPWARALVQAAPFISEGLQHALEYIGELFTAGSSDPSTWRRVQWVWERVGDVDVADRQVFTWDLANITNGAVDSSWTEADYVAVEGELSAWFTAVRAVFPSTARLIERRYYVMGFTDLAAGTNLADDKPYIKSGAPERVYPVGIVGSGTAQMQPPQIAMSVTEKTAYPRHWGRFYLPFPHAANNGTDGYIATATVDSVAAATNTYYAALQAREFFPVVPVTQIEKNPARALLTVNELQVDNNWDVIRRRRKKTTTYRKILP